MNSHKIGAHVSAAGGIDKAVGRAAAIGCNCVQVFSGSPRVWKKPSLDLHPVEKLFAAQQEFSVSPIFTHALYLVNLASDKPELMEKSINSIIYELEFDSLIKGAGVIVHLGSHQGRGWEGAKQQVADTLIHILKNTPNDSTLLIENSAGQNGKLCSELSEIRWLLDQVYSPRLGWCLDTCHAHTAGYAFSSESDFFNYPEENGTGVLRSTLPLNEVLTSLNLWSTLKLIHVNDSKDAFGSGRDRHDNLGDGNIPIEDLKFFLNLPEVQNIPFVLEVPGLDGTGPDAENVQRLQKILE